MFVTLGGCATPEDVGAPANDVATTTSALETSINTAGIAESLHTSGTIDRTNPFFQQLGTNPRTCETCHSPQQGWTTNSLTSSILLFASLGLNPLFNLVDNGIRPDADISTFPARLNTFLHVSGERALTRFTRTINPAAEFTLTAVADPYGFSTTTAFSGFRRPTPTANETKTPSILWTGSPTTDVITQLRGILPGGARLHEQRDPTLPPVSQAQADAAGDFMFGVIFAQSFDFKAGSLTAAGAKGGPANLMAQTFYTGINDTGGHDPHGNPFNPHIFDIYDAWSVYAANFGNDQAGARGAIYRGQELFSGAGKCGGCHNAPNVGVQSQVKFFNTGTAEPPKCSPLLPLLTLENKTTHEVKITCDPGRALATGLWSDVGRFRAPPLRGLAARAPYFHDGQAATLGDVIEHYNTRFVLNLTDQQKGDLKAFLLAL